jgi:hypothetical protein
MASTIVIHFVSQSVGPFFPVGIVNHEVGIFKHHKGKRKTTGGKSVVRTRLGDHRETRFGNMDLLKIVLVVSKWIIQFDGYKFKSQKAVPQNKRES